MNDSKTVIVGASGGIDSAVSAYLLRSQGYQIKLVFLDLFDNEHNEKSKEDFKSIAGHLDAPWEIYPMRDKFNNRIIENFLNEYSKNRTPNPCVLCNAHIKFSALYSIMKKENASFIATGHYALKEPCVFEGKQFTSLLPAKDSEKDQAYYLYRIPSKILQATLFPLGWYTKNEIKNIFHREFDWMPEKKESQDICFLPEGDYRPFYRKRRAVTAGFFKTLDGQKIKHHDGSQMYTIGQRRGLNVALGKPVYVVRMEENGDIILGEKDSLKLTGFLLENMKFFFKNSLSPEKKYPAMVQVRYKASKHLCYFSVDRQDENMISIELKEPLSGVTPGQSGVLYDVNSNALLGGGFIRLKE